MKKIISLFILIGSLWITGNSQNNIQVTLEVDMTAVNDLYDGGAVWVYMDAGWNEYYDMTDEDGDGKYAYTLEKEAGSTLTYRFSYQTGADPWSEYVEESVPAECANVDGFREVILPQNDITYDGLAYEGCAEGPITTTIQVDMNNVADMEPGGSVWVYMDGGWNEYYDMLDMDGDGVYSFSLQKEAGSTLTYRFAYQNGPDPWTNYHEENVPNDCANADGFREYAIPNTHSTLPGFVYGSCGDVPTPMVNVTFQVNMSGVDNPNDVQVVIKNPWIWTSLVDQGDGIWSASVLLDGNSTYPFTYVNGGQDNWGEEESVPEECNFGTMSAPERHVSVGTEDLVLELVAFGSCDAYPPGEKIEVALHVDINDVTDFWPGGSVWVFMDAGWNEYYDMTDEDGDGVYSIALDRAKNENFSYRFSYQNGEDPWSNYIEEIVPEACANADGFREVILPAHDLSLDPIGFGSCAGDPVSITFQVDLNHVDDLYPGGAVWVYMDPGWNEYYDMTDEDGDGIYTFTYEKEAGSELTYRFSYQNGEDPWSNYDEENVPDECSNDDGFRTFNVPNVDVTLQAFVYGSCGDTITPNVYITFQVDMSVVDNPNDVQVVIKNPWIWTGLTDQGGDIWSGTVEVDANSTYPFTYVNGGQDNWGEEESVPEECNFGTDSAPERHVTIGEEDIILDIVTYGECDYINNTDEIGEAMLEIYPNPCNDIINISISDDNIISLDLYDMSGKMVHHEKHNSLSSLRLNLQNFEKGLYFIQVKGLKKIHNSKVLIN